MTAKTSDDYKPCVVVYPDGKIRKANVLHIRIDSFEQGRRKLLEDKAAWLSYEDYERLQAEMTR
jgi:hypothetical protein